METTVTKVKDPVCGMTIAAESAAGNIEYQGETYYFCSNSCKEKFEANPAQFVSPANRSAKIDSPVTSEDVSSGRRNDHSTVNGTGERVDLPITGMTCAACANRIEKKLNKQRGVEKASVNFATSKATINYDPNKTGVADLIQTVKDVGYDTAGRKKNTILV